MNNNSEKNYKMGYKAGWISIISNIILFAFKLWAGIISNSVAMIADAWHTLSDSATSIVVIIGLWVSRKKADEDHPYGHGRAENVGAIVISTLLVVIGIKFFIESVNKLISGSVSDFKGSALIIFAVSAVIKEIMAVYAIHTGKNIDSASLQADGWHHRSDAIISVVIVTGVLVGKNIVWLDGVLGILVSLFILYTSYELIRNVSSSLLGENVEPELENKIKVLIKEIEPFVFNVHHLHLHKYGSHSELTLHIVLPADIKLNESHNITKKLELAIKSKFNMDTTIHVEPILKEFSRI